MGIVSCTTETEMTLKKPALLRDAVKQMAEAEQYRMMAEPEFIYINTVDTYSGSCSL